MWRCLFRPFCRKRLGGIQGSKGTSSLLLARGSHGNGVIVLTHLAHRELLKRLEIKGVQFAPLTLHVGLGTFRMVEVEDLTKHKMDSEQIWISEDACQIVNGAKDARRNICAVGTTVMRTVESSVSTQGHMKPFEGWTNKFIFPPYDFSVANRMITNFHLPLSTLQMMVAGFAGYDHLMKAYKEAIKEKYRFGTYGDAMLIL